MKQTLWFQVTSVLADASQTQRTHRPAGGPDVCRPTGRARGQSRSTCRCCFLPASQQRTRNRLVSEVVNFLPPTLSVMMRALAIPATLPGLS